MSATNKEMRYDAFISYRHSELDKFVAEELHRQMESFKVPGSVAKKCKKKKINRIFRDKDELPITSNLADPIMNALRESEFLIVICSPRLKESIWCKREIENFIEMHGQEKILAVLVEGEPSESFPEELLYREKTVVNANGETTVVREPVEPLAADVRGKNKKEVKKLIKTEMLRLLASMLQCNYDDLKQRHRERKMHRMLALAAVVCVVGLTFGTVSTVMALKIQNQKEQIDKQYWEALENNARMGADNSVELLQEGDRIGAITMARELLPDNLENQGIPYTAEAYFALTESIYPYAAGDVLRPIFQIKENAEISEIKLSNDRSKLYVRTKYNLLTVWDIPNKKKCLEIDLKALGSYDGYSDDVDFIGKDKIGVLGSDEAYIFDLENNETGEIGKQIAIEEIEYPHYIVGDREGNNFLVIASEAVGVYSAKTGEMLSIFETPEDLSVMMSEDYLFKGDSELVLIYGSKFFDDEKKPFKIKLVDYVAGTVETEIEVPYGSLAQLDTAGDYLFVAINGDLGENISIFETEDAMVYCYNIRSGEKLWQYEAKSEFISSIVVPYEGYDCFLVESYAQITALEAKTGKVIGLFTFGSDIVNIFPLQTPDTYVIFTRDGRRVNLIPEKNMNLESIGTFIPATTNIKQFEWGDGFLASLPYSSKELIVYDWYIDEGAKVALELSDNIAAFAISADEKYSVIELFNDEFFVIDNDTQEVLGQTISDSYTYGLYFIDDDKIQKISGDEVFIYDLQCNLLEQYEISEKYIGVEGVSIDGKYIYGDEFENLVLINAATKEVEGKLTKEQCECDGTYSYAFGNTGDICVILDKTRSQFRSYDVSEGTLLNCIDINATYIEKILFSEDDSYVYFVYEDGRVEQYVTDTMERKCEVAGLDSITNVIKEYTINGEKTFCFYGTSVSYILKEYDGQLKVEQKIDSLKGVMPGRGEYRITNSTSLLVFPIYTYEEMLGKADRICYDNSLWNNN